MAALLFTLGSGLFVGCNGNPGPSATATSVTEPSGLFRDVTTESGIQFTYRNGEEADHFAILETVGGGVALLDYDGDGLLDVAVAGGGYFEGKTIGGYGCKLYKNLGNLHFRDVTQETGLDKPQFYTHGCAVADYDCDGWPDLLVTGWGRVALYHNEPDGKGGRHFVEVTKAAGLADDLWSTSAAWGDLDGDGFPDLYVCHYVNWSFANHPRCIGLDLVARDVCPPANFNALPHKLYRNNGNGTFTDVSAQAGLHVNDADKNFGKGMGVIVADLNGDGRPDIYVANDTSGNFLYLNRTRGVRDEGRGARGEVGGVMNTRPSSLLPSPLLMEDVAVPSGAAHDETGTPTGSMGVAVADYNGSGRPSLWVTNFDNELPALYRSVEPDNPGEVPYRHASTAAGIAVVGRSNVGWGTAFVDVEHRGWEDLIFVNGHTNRFLRGNVGWQQYPFLLRNEGNGKFSDRTGQAGSYFLSRHRARGLAVGDLDNDGRIDLIVSHVNEPLTVLRNEAGNDYHWLGIELVGRGHRHVAGATLSLEVGGRRLTRFAVGGGSYLSCNDARHVFGLADATHVGRFRVKWPWGAEQEWINLAVDRYWRLSEGKTDAEMR